MTDIHTVSDITDGGDFIDYLVVVRRNAQRQLMRKVENGILERMMLMQPGQRIEYAKACACHAGATTMRQTVEMVRDEVRSTHMMRATIIPGPSCDQCGKAWTEHITG